MMLHALVVLSIGHITSHLGGFCAPFIYVTYFIALAPCLYHFMSLCTIAKFRAQRHRTSEVTELGGWIFCVLASCICHIFSYFSISSFCLYPFMNMLL